MSAATVGLLVLATVARERGDEPGFATPHAREALALSRTTQVWSADAATGAATDERVPLASSPAEGAWYTDHVMVLPALDASLDDIARAVGTTVRREAGPSGYGALAVPTGWTRDKLLATLATSDLVADSGLDGVLVGTSAHASSARARSWHLEAIGLSPDESEDFSDYVVAVLDTGVAYYNVTRGGVRYRKVPGLASIDIVAPLDLVTGRRGALDDHQHGTHVASIIAARGAYPGVAPGVSLMPVKVLTRDNRGSELDLIDGITHAVENGADVINMSVAFVDGYQPGSGILGALDAAADAGVIMIAPSGNHGSSDELSGSGLTTLPIGSLRDAVAWPAAASQVIAVTALSPGADGGYDRPDYAVAAVGTDVAAPGGDVSVDNDGDGVVDGVPAQTIALGDPGTIETVLMAGTSQATAVVSGVVVRLLAAGVDPSLVPAALQLGASGADFYGGLGAGLVDVDGALAAAVDAPYPADPCDVAVGLLPYLLQDGMEVTPTALITLVDGSGADPADVAIMGRIWSQDETWSFECAPEATGETSSQCVVDGEPSTLGDADDPKAWGLAVDAVVRDGVSSHPGGALFVTEQTLALLQGLHEETGLEGAAIAFGWSAGDYDLGTLGDAFAAVDQSTGPTMPPMAALFTADAVAGHSLSEFVELELDGTLAGSDTVDGVEIELLHIETLHSGDLDLAALSGEGLTTLPIGSLHDGAGSSGYVPLACPDPVTLSILEAGAVDPLVEQRTGTVLTTDPLLHLGAESGVEGGASAAVEGTASE